MPQEAMNRFDPIGPSMFFEWTICIAYGVGRLPTDGSTLPSNTRLLADAFPSRLRRADRAAKPAR